MKPRVPTGGLTILILCSTILSGLVILSQPSSGHPLDRISPSFEAVSPLVNNRPFDYIVIILMENKNFNQIDDSATAPYLNQLAHNYSLATRYSACDHPSLPNYMCLTGGNNYFSGIDCSPSVSCSTSNSSIVDRVESAGLTWKAYLEDMPAPCYKNASGNYTFATNPFIFYDNIGNNSTRCTAHVIPANSGGNGPPDDNLLNALGSTSTASNFMWLTPNLCDNMHNCTISRGDNYLSKLVPLILNSYIFKNEKAALLITFDEGYGIYPTDYVYTIWAGSTVKNHYQSSNQYSHFSLPRTLESVWDLVPLTAKDQGSPPMMEFFPSPSSPPPLLKANFTFTPSDPDQSQLVNFSGLAMGGAQPYSYTWSFGDGDRGTGQSTGHVYVHIGDYTVNLTIADTFGQIATTSGAIFVDTQPSPAGTCQGCTKTTSPRTLGLMISFAIGAASSFLGSKIISRRRPNGLKPGMRTTGDLP